MLVVQLMRLSDGLAETSPGSHYVDQGNIWVCVANIEQGHFFLLTNMTGTETDSLQSSRNPDIVTSQKRRVLVNQANTWQMWLSR